MTIDTGSVLLIALTGLVNYILFHRKWRFVCNLIYLFISIGIIMISGTDTLVLYAGGLLTAISAINLLYDMFAKDTGMGKK